MTQDGDGQANAAIDGATHDIAARESSGDSLSTVTLPGLALGRGAGGRESSGDSLSTVTDGPIVVGLGASAGGLEALQTFFAHMPSDSGLSFVIVTHQAANRVSLLPMLIAKRTAMPVVEVSDGARVEPNHVYVAPPGRRVTLLNRRLHSYESEDSSAHRLPVDAFFRSLAHDRQERAIAIVLSGTGTDGTLGLKEIKAALGLTIVQSEHEALFAGMPHSAITGDSPDFVLPVSEIPGRLLTYLRSAHHSRVQLANERSVRNGEAMQQIFLLLQQRTGHGFSAYKETTLRRRLERRMNLHRIESLSEYAQFLQTHPAELDLLFDELLIGVTSFFRDPAAFESLGTLFRQLLAEKPDGYALRAWVAGCSTGEEAYSIAILLRECLDLLKRDCPVQIFATDLDPKAIDYARVGFYPSGIAGDLSPARLKRFFVHHESGYQVRKELREMLVFATQNLIEDPPFTKLDLLACRNLLIYIDAGLQKRLVPMFHYVLKRGGVLLLGSSETIGGFSHLFEPFDKKWRLYRRREVAGGSHAADMVSAPAFDGSPMEATHTSALPRRADLSTAQLADKLLLRDLVPPTVLMRERGEILHIHGRTGLFLEPAPGPQSNANIFGMAREGLHLELAAALRQAARKDEEVLRRGVRVKTNGDLISVDLRVRRLPEPEALKGLYRVSFEQTRQAIAEDAPARDPADAQASSRVLALERELQYTKESHQGTIEELETANEELKSTNEELQSTNEELQSANEELETSKEELQSLNEELQTVNLELHGKVEELSRANDDMTNLLNATDIATIFLDNDLNIKRHTEQAKRVIRLIPSDVGRSIGDLVSRLRYDQLVEDAREVLRTLVFKEAELQGQGDGKWYLMRIMPYRTTENRIDGLVVTFVDITRVKLLQQNEQMLRDALQHSPVSVFGIDAELRFTWACSVIFAHDPKSIVGKTFDETLSDAQPALKAAVERVIAQGSPVREQLDTVVLGRSLRFDVYLEPQLDGERKVRGATCVAVQIAGDQPGPAAA